MVIRIIRIIRRIHIRTILITNISRKTSEMDVFSIKALFALFDVFGYTFIRGSLLQSTQGLIFLSKSNKLYKNQKNFTVM